MSDKTFLDWPFFEERHRHFATELDQWCETAPALHAHPTREQTDQACRELVRALGAAGWLRHCVSAGPNGAWGGASDALDSRTLCIARETLARHAGLADFAFAMQGLGSGAITIAGDAALRGRYLPKVAAGEAIAAFALSEPDAGSDVAAMAC